MAKKKQDKKLKDVAKIRRQIEKMKERGHSEWCEARQSPIHGSGVYAKKFIPAETRILEYVGEKITNNPDAAKMLSLPFRKKWKVW